MTVPYRARVGKKLLVATVGLATLTIGACGDEVVTSGNLIPPPPEDMGVDLTVGNLLPPADAGLDEGLPDATPGDDAEVPDAAPADSDVTDVDFSVGNLIPPPLDLGPSDDDASSDPSS